jgi:hypothetical protein
MKGMSPPRVEADLALQRSVGVEFSPARPVGLVHLVVAVPVELDRVVTGAAGEGAGDAAEGELAAGGFEEDVGRLHHVGVVVVVARQLHDPPSAQDTHAAASRSLGRRTRL